MNDIDFSRSFVRFTSSRVNHTPRLQIDAACTLTGPDGKSRQYFLSTPCIGEEMYVDTKLIHDPVMEVWFVIKPDDQFLMIKRVASADGCSRAAHRVNEAMPTQSGIPSKVTELGAHVEHFPRMKPISTYAEFRDALLGYRAIHARTTYTDRDAKVVMDYPTKTVNVAHGREAWQVDAGPILIPSEPQSGDLEVTRFNLAYIVFNTTGHTEVCVRRPVPLAEGGKVLHYADARPLANCRNELFAAV